MCCAFPFIFRGALDVGATTITRPMEIAAVHAIADLARQEQSDIVAAAYGGIEDLSFGPDYLIPKPFDPRLIVKIAPAVAKAAMESGVARPADPRFGGLRPAPAAIRLSQRHVDAADLRGSAQHRAASAAASSMPRARTSGCCARCRSPSMKSWPCRSSSAGRR